MTKQYDYICRECEGLVTRPMVAYGWGGQFCHCKEHKYITREDVESKSLEEIYALMDKNLSEFMEAAEEFIKLSKTND